MVSVDDCEEVHGKSTTPNNTCVYYIVLCDWISTCKYAMFA